MSAVLRQALPVLRAPVVAGPLAAAVLVVAAATRALEGPGLAVLRGAAVLLAVAVAGAADEPLARLLDASPTPWRTRLVARALPVALAVAVVWSAALAWAAVHGDPPAAALTLELLALCALAAALATAVRRRWGTAEPAVLVGPVLGGLFLAAGRLPRPGLLEQQVWGPPWEAAHLRWSGLLLAALVVLALATADPVLRRWPAAR